MAIRKEKRSTFIFRYVLINVPGVPKNACKVDALWLLFGIQLYSFGMRQCRFLQCSNQIKKIFCWAKCLTVSHTPTNIYLIFFRGGGFRDQILGLGLMDPDRRSIYLKFKLGLLLLKDKSPRVYFRHWSPSTDSASWGQVLVHHIATHCQSCQLLTVMWTNRTRIKRKTIHCPKASKTLMTVAK